MARASGGRTCDPSWRVCSPGVRYLEPFCTGGLFSAVCLCVRSFIHSNLGSLILILYIEL